MIDKISKDLFSTENIRKLVYYIRNEQVMLDYDLAVLYGYEVKKLNQQVKRHINRFPKDFMFQLTNDEVNFVKSQFATSSIKGFLQGQDGGRRTLPYAFTEHLKILENKQISLEIKVDNIEKIWFLKVKLIIL